MGTKKVSRPIKSRQNISWPGKLAEKIPWPSKFPKKIPWPGKLPKKNFMTRKFAVKNFMTPVIPSTPGGLLKVTTPLVNDDRLRFSVFTRLFFTSLLFNSKKRSNVLIWFSMFLIYCINLCFSPLIHRNSDHHYLPNSFLNFGGYTCIVHNALKHPLT